MKKLALIVLLAVVASRFLSERDVRPDHPPVRPFSIVSAIFDDEPPIPPAPPRPPHRWADAPEPPDRPEIRTFSWRDRDREPGRLVDAKSRRRSEPIESRVVVGSSQQAPAWFPQSDEAEKELAKADDSGLLVLVGRLSISEARAKDDLRLTLNRAIGDWLAADAPTDWVPPKKLVDRMVLSTFIQEAAPPKSAVVAGLDESYKMYRAGQKLDFSGTRRADFLKHYHRDVASARMKRSAGVIGVVLATLALISIYIRADEATKGYHTNRLRVLVLAGLGVAGVVAYRYWI